MPHDSPTLRKPTRNTIFKEFLKNVGGKSLFAAQAVFDSAVDEQKNPQAAVTQTTLDSH